MEKYSYLKETPNSLFLVYLLDKNIKNLKKFKEMLLKGMLRATFCIGINTHSAKNEELCEIYFKNRFLV